MAAPAPRQRELLLDELICAICREYFAEPVLTGCGHNFCRGCITRYWERGEATACPECRKPCSRTELIPNVQLGTAAQKVRCLPPAAPHSAGTDRGEFAALRDAPKLFGQGAHTPVSADCKAPQVRKDPAVSRLEDAAPDQKTTRGPETLSRCEEEENFLKPSKINSESKTEVYREGIEPTELSTPGSKEPFSAGHHLPALRLGNYRIPKVIIFVVPLLLAILVFFIGVVVGRSNSPVTAKEPDAPDCPRGWVGYLEKCYYFSETKGNWTDRQSHCFSLNASLVVIDTAQDLAFLFRHKGLFDHWIGLWRDQEEQLWKWPNGTEFNNLFQVNGKGDCVYLNNNEARSSSCHVQRHWICSTLDGFTKRKQNALHRNSPF